MSELAAAAGKIIAEGAEHMRSVSHVFEGLGEEGAYTKHLFETQYYPTKARHVEAALATDFAAVNNAPRGTAPPVDIGKRFSEGAKVARAHIGGAKDYRFVMAAKAVEKKHGVLAAESYTNALAFLLQDVQDPMAGAKDMAPADLQAHLKNIKQMGVGTSPYSPLKDRVIKAGVPLKDSKPSYQKSAPHVRAAMSAVSAGMAPMVSIPHIATTFNGMFGSSPQNFLRGLSIPLIESAKLVMSGDMHPLRTQMEIMSARLNTGVHAESLARAIHEHNLFKATGVPKWRQNGAAQLAYKLVHQPGFSPLRDYTLLSGVNVGLLTMRDSAQRFAKTGDARYAAQLAEFGLEPKDIATRGGTLSDQDIQKGVYRFVDKHYFLDNTLSRSMALQGSTLGRVLGLYHGYVTRQSKLMASTFRDAFTNKNERLRGMRNFVLLTTAFPAMGELIKLSLMGIRGQDAKGQAIKDYEAMTGQTDNPIWDGVNTYAEAYGHIGGLGIYNHMLRGTFNHGLLGELGGPIVDAGAKAGTDVVQGVGKSLKQALSDNDEVELQKNMAPLERDIMYDIPYVSTLANVFSKRILPKANDEEEEDPFTQLWNHMRSPSDSDNADNNSNP